MPTQNDPKGTERHETDDLGSVGKRTPGSQRSHELETLLHAMNDHLQKAAGDRMFEGPLPFKPVFVVGCPRSGSTLLLQDIASRGALACPTNLMSRFYGDPWVGALAQRILHDLDPQGEIFPTKTAMNTASVLGKTTGAAAPHEFWYWWRRYFRFAQHHGEHITLTPDQRRMFRRDLAGMMSVFNKPMVFKAMMTSWCIDLLHEVVPEAIFLFLERDIEANAASLLRAREEFYGDRAQWWAFRPPAIAEILKLDPVEQVFAQVQHTKAAVLDAFGRLPADRQLHWQYEAFCTAPGGHHQELLRALGHAPTDERTANSEYGVSAAEWPADVDPHRLAELKAKYAG